jgi:hypothetical protein
MVAAKVSYLRTSVTAAGDSTAAGIATRSILLLLLLLASLQQHVLPHNEQQPPRWKHIHHWLSSSSSTSHRCCPAGSSSTCYSLGRRPLLLLVSRLPGGCPDGCESLSRHSRHCCRRLSRRGSSGSNGGVRLVFEV